jgi:hypothetical protein
MATAREVGNIATGLRTAGAIAILLVTAPAWASPQSPNAAGDQPERGEEESAPSLETEFVASTSFQEGTVIARLRSPLSLDAHYFGLDDNDIGVVGLSWTFAWRSLRVAPGLAWAFGRDNRPAPTLTARWSYEHPRWVTEGLWVQSLEAHLPQQSEESGGEDVGDDEVRHASVLDGVHFSARIGRAELGPLIEHIQYREEREWKGGVRAAWRVARGIRLIAQLLGPDTEVRGGLAWER